MDCSMPGLPFTIYRSLPKFMSIESVMPSNHLILCCPLLLLPSIFPSIGSYPESAFRIRWPSFTWTEGASASVLPDEMTKSLCAPAMSSHGIVIALLVFVVNRDTMQGLWGLGVTVPPPQRLAQYLTHKRCLNWTQALSSLMFLLPASSFFLLADGLQ